MKREWFALALLVLLFAGSIFNLRILDSLNEAIEEEIALSCEAFYYERFDDAKAHFDAATSRWQKAKGYTHIFIRHAEIDAVSDALFELKQTIDEHNGAALPSVKAKLLYHLDSIDEMEHVRLGSVL